MKQSARGFVGIAVLLVGCAQPESRRRLMPNLKALSRPFFQFKPGCLILASERFIFAQMGGISLVEFRDGRTLEAPTLESDKEKLTNVDILEYYHIPLDLIVLRANEETAQRFFPKAFEDEKILPAISPRDLPSYPDILLFCKKLGSTACWGHLVSEGDRGDVIIRFSPDWNIQEIELPDGTIETEPILDLSEEDIEGVDLVGHLSYRLLVYRDRTRPEEEIQRILVPAVVGVEVQ